MARLLLTLALLLVALALLVVWTATAAITNLSFAVSNAASQATIQLLACALLAMVLFGLPGLLYTAFRVGKVSAFRNQETVSLDSPVMTVSLPTTESAAKALPAPSAITQLEVEPRRRIRRTPRPVREATRVARRWFQ